MEPLMPELIGWFSSATLLFTLSGQVYRQWRARSVEGVSWVLFAGQILASVGFVTYSVLIGNVVFIVTNSLILATAVAGQCIYLQRRRASRRRAPTTPPRQPGERPRDRDSAGTADADAKPGPGGARGPHRYGAAELNGARSRE
jgi:uncharacterized protein with PQ loop repeat